MQSLHVKTEKTEQTVVIYNIHDFPYTSCRLGVDTVASGKKGGFYYNLPMAFDIETTTIQDKDGSYSGFMYIWQVCVGSRVCMGRTWGEFKAFVHHLTSAFDCTLRNKLVCYVHNLSFEFQFMRNFFEFEDLFARSERDVVKCTIAEGIEFRCSYTLSNMGLDRFLKSRRGVTFFKQSGKDFDYSKLRTPETELTDEELAYCYCDVRGLCEALYDMLKEDTLATIPMTSTGFVRREARDVVLANPKNWWHMKNTRLTPVDYGLCCSAVRGGNCHNNSIYTNMTLENLGGEDLASSYPAAIMLDDHPMSGFLRRSPKQFEVLLADKRNALLMDITLYDVSIKSYKIIPYIARANCGKFAKDTRLDNGRVISSAELRMVITDVDFKIIQSQYNIGRYQVNILRSAIYGKLPKELRQLVHDYFQKKTELKKGDPYFYNKFKNRINAIFGMMLTNVCNPEIVYDPAGDDKEHWTGWTHQEVDVVNSLNRYYNNRKSFLSYQWGIWVTANARARLQEGLDAISNGLICEDGTVLKGAYDTVYCDTDSIKYLGDHKAVFDELNRRTIAKCEAADVPAYAEVDGKKHYLGVWEHDADYRYFRSMGAKKYAYVEKGDPEEKVHVTVAGLSKQGGSEFFSKGGIESFKLGAVVPAGISGRTAAYYKDIQEPEWININGCLIQRGSSMGIVNVAYTLGVTPEYSDYFEENQSHMLSIANPGEEHEGFDA